MRLPPFLLLLVLAPLGVRAEPALLSPATEIADPAADPGWRNLLDGLAPRQGQQSRFEEKRYFPFRKSPIVLTGEIRIAPARGLSLSYLTPQPQVLIADERGFLLRDGAGRDFPAAAAGSGQLAVAALVDLLRFDVADLHRKFMVHGRRRGEQWTLAFVPRDRELAENLEAIVVSGARTALDEIELLTSARQHIDIFVSHTRQPVVFDPGDLARYFR